MKARILECTFALLLLLHAAEGQDPDEVIVAVIVSVVLLGIAGGAVLLVVILAIRWRRQKKEKNFLYRRRYKFSGRKLVKNTAGMAEPLDIDLEDDFTPDERLPKRTGTKTVTWSVDLVQASAKKVSCTQDVQKRIDSKVRTTAARPTHHQIVTSLEAASGPARTQQGVAVPDVNSSSSASQTTEDISSTDALNNKEQQAEMTEPSSSGGGGSGDGSGGADEDGVTISVETTPGTSTKGQLNTTVQASATGAGGSESPPKLKSIMKICIKDPNVKKLPAKSGTVSPTGKTTGRRVIPSRVQQFSRPSDDSEVSTQPLESPVAVKSRSALPLPPSPVRIAPLDLDALVMSSGQGTLGASHDEKVHLKEETDHPLDNAGETMLQVGKGESEGTLQEASLETDQQSTLKEEVASGDGEEPLVSTSADLDENHSADQLTDEERMPADSNQQSSLNSESKPNQEETLPPNEHGFDANSNEGSQLHKETDELLELRTSSTTNLLQDSDELNSQSDEGCEPDTTAAAARKKGSIKRKPDTSTVLVFGQVDDDEEEDDDDLDQWEDGEASSQENLTGVGNRRLSQRKEDNEANEDSDTYYDDEIPVSYI